MKTKLFLLLLLICFRGLSQSNNPFSTYKGQYADWLQNPDRLDILKNPKKYTVINTTFEEVAFDGNERRLIFRYDSIRNVVSGVFMSANFVYDIHGVYEGEGMFFALVFNKSNILQGILMFGLPKKYCQEILFLNGDRSDTYNICRIM